MRGDDRSRRPAWIDAQLGRTLRSTERRMRTPLFVREWEHLRSEFESFPEFVELVTSVQDGKV